MTSLELKTNLLKTIDEIDNLDVLEDLTIIVDHLLNKADRDFWDELSVDERKEIDIALNESENEKNLVTNEQVMSELKKWLTK